MPDLIPMQCPSCKVDLTGYPIPEDQSEMFGGSTHFSQVVGIVERDRVVRWMCLNCGHEWEREVEPCQS